MVLLGVNAGFGNTDIANLPIGAVDLESGWCDFARVKNGTPRRVPLWKETCDSLREWLAARPKPKDPKHAGLMFLNRRGGKWVQTSPDGRRHSDRVGDAFSRLLKRLGLKRARVGFYSLRHGFETIGDPLGHDEEVLAVALEREGVRGVGLGVRIAECDQALAEPLL